MPCLAHKLTGLGSAINGCTDGGGDLFERGCRFLKGCCLLFCASGEIVGGFPCVSAWNIDPSGGVTGVQF